MPSAPTSPCSREKRRITCDSYNHFRAVLATGLDGSHTELLPKALDRRHLYKFMFRIDEEVRYIHETYANQPKEVLRQTRPFLYL